MLLKQKYKMLESDLKKRRKSNQTMPKTLLEEELVQVHLSINIISNRVIQTGMKKEQLHYKRRKIFPNLAFTLAVNLRIQYQEFLMCLKIIEIMVNKAKLMSNGLFP